jgi:uncharacterized protein (DUF486 family)
MPLISVAAFYTSLDAIAFAISTLIFLATGLTRAEQLILASGRRLGVNEQSLLEYKSFCNDLTLVTVASIAAYSIFDLLKLDWLRDAYKENYGLVLSAIGILLLVTSLMVAVIEFAGSESTRHSFHIFWINCTFLAERLMAGIRTAVAVAVFGLPLAIACILPYYSLELTLDLLSIMLFGTIAYSMVFVGAMLFIRDRHARGLLAADMGAVLSLVAVAGLLFQANFYQAAYILGH